MQRRAGNREINIGLDSAILIGHPAATSSALILVPIAILLSVVLPGNRVILFVDLAVIPFLVATALAPLFTSAAVAAGFALPPNAAQITSIVDGFLWTSYVTVELVRYLGIFGIVVIAVATLGAMVPFQCNRVAWERSVGFEKTPSAAE